MGKLFFRNEMDGFLLIRTTTAYDQQRHMCGVLCYFGGVVYVYPTPLTKVRKILRKFRISSYNGCLELPKDFQKPWTQNWVILSMRFEAIEWRDTFACVYS